jgi:hypothetical protein
MSPRPDYIWDGGGEPEAEVADIERALSQYGLQGRPWEAKPSRAHGGRTAWAWVGGLAVAAAIAATVVGLGLASTEPRCPVDGWGLTATRGSLTCDRLQVGAWLETDPDTAIQLEVADIGALDIEPESRLRIVASDPTQHRVELERGRLHALIDAPPRLFVVDTPAGRAIDLGCAYTLDVDDTGAGDLVVELGEVMLAGEHAEVLVPADARAHLRPGHDPSTPHHVDASPDFVAALGRVDVGGDVAPLLALAGARDSVTLWNLIARVPEAQRPALIAKLDQLVPRPADLDEAAVISADPAALQRWRDAMPW